MNNILDDESIKIGEIDQETYSNDLDKEIKQNVSMVDKQLVGELTRQGGFYTERYKNLLSERGFTYEEYLALFYPPSSHLDYHKYPVYQVLGITSEHQRKMYTMRFSNDEQGYMGVLKTIPKLKAKFFQRKVEARIPRKMMWEHVYINGSSGSGKSTLMKRLIYSLSKGSDANILIDPQGKLAKEVKNFSHLQSDDIVYIAPNSKDGFTPSINFLDKKRGNDANGLALRIARMVSVLIEGELSPPMLSLLRPCLSVLIEAGGFSISDLKRFMLKEENEDLVQLGLNHPDPEYVSTFRRLNDAYFSRTRNAIISKLDFILQDKVFRQLTSGETTVDLMDAIEKGKTIIVDLGGTEQDTKEAFGRLMIALIVHIAFTRQGGRRMFLHVDELQNFLSPDIVKILDEARQKKLHIVMAHQRIGQLKSNIKANKEESYIDSIIGNTAVKMVGYNDSPDTITLFSTKLGVDKGNLTSIKNYQFWLRVKGRTDLLFHSSNTINSSALYLSSKDAKKRDEYMLKKYYKPIGVKPGSEQYEKYEPQKKSTTDRTDNLRIDLDKHDF